MAFKEATDIFKNSKILLSIINQHLLKILMGPNYQESPQYEIKLKQLDSKELDECYCFLYFPQTKSNSLDQNGDVS